jgi:hypothetical protein
MFFSLPVKSSAWSITEPEKNACCWYGHEVNLTTIPYKRKENPTKKQFKLEKFKMHRKFPLLNVMLNS